MFTKMCKSENSQHSSLIDYPSVHEEESTLTNKHAPTSQSSQWSFLIIESRLDWYFVFPNTIFKCEYRNKSLPLRISVLYWRRLVLCLRGHRPSLWRVASTALASSQRSPVHSIQGKSILTIRLSKPFLEQNANAF